MSKKRIIEVKAHFDSGYALIHYPVGIVTGLGAAVAGLRVYGLILPFWALLFVVFALLVACVSIGYMWNNRGWLAEQTEFNNRRNPSIRRLLRNVKTIRRRGR